MQKSIVGNWGIHLDENQQKVYKDVEDLIKREKEHFDGSHDLTKAQKPNMNLRHIVLYGGHGTGKTILGVEFVKMFLEKLRQEQSPINIFVLNLNSLKRRSEINPQVIRQLRNIRQHGDNFIPIKFRDLEFLLTENTFFFSMIHYR